MVDRATVFMRLNYIGRENVDRLKRLRSGLIRCSEEIRFPLVSSLADLYEELVDAVNVLRNHTLNTSHRLDIL